MSYGVQSAGLFSTSSTDGSTSNSLRPFAGLDLTEDQRTQIRSIFKNAKSEGLTQDQIEQEIESILTPAQLATYQSNLATNSADSTDSDSSSSSSSSTASSSTSSSLSAQGAPPPPGGNPFTDPNGPFANLNLTSDEQSQISQILQNAQSEGLSFSQVNAQISDILTTAQQATFSSDLANLPAPPSANGSTSGSSGSSASQSVAQQIAAAAALILQQIQQDIENNDASSSSSSSSTSGSATQSSQTSSSLGTSASSSTTTLQQQIAAAAEAILQQIEQAAASAASDSSSSTTGTSSTAAAQTPPDPFADPNGPFANLDLSSDQQSQIAQILASAPASGLSFSQVNAQISALLTTTQQATFTSDLANLPPPPGAGGSGDASTASAGVSGQSQIGSDGTTASTGSVTETGVQQQIAAAESLILQQIQYDLGYAAT